MTLETGGSVGLMPKPWRMELTSRSVSVAAVFTEIETDPGVIRALGRVNAVLGLRMGVTLPIAFAVAEHRPALPRLGDDESYRLEIGPEAVVVEAARYCGALRALATLAQLAASDQGLPIGRIEDKPKYPWRGLMLDVARRFLSIPALLQVIDAMAFYKLNVLHLHLSDDQGFRLQSDVYPKLASPQCYSATQLRELVQRAAQAGIRVVPELDMPGHVTSWLAAYPEWGLPSPVGASKRFGVHKAVLNVAEEAVYEVIDALFGELSKVFTDPCVHLGGDEVHPAGWMESPEVRAYMSLRGIADAVALQAHFNQRVAAIAERHGKRLIGWDEVLNGGAPEGMIVQTWRGATARDRAIAAGHACIDSAGYYLDLFYPADVHHAWDPMGATEDRLAQENALLDDPRLKHVAAGLRWTHAWRDSGADVSANSGTAQTDREAIHDNPPFSTRIDNSEPSVLGGEACLWGELVDERVLPVRLWSRLPVVAERLWCVDIPDLGDRLATSLDQLGAAGFVDVQQTSRELLLAFGVAEAQIDSVELLEPIKWYGRLLGEATLQARIEGTEMPLARPYDLDTPLNRPVDALLPESFAAKRFARLLKGQHSSTPSGESPTSGGGKPNQRMNLSRSSEVPLANDGAPSRPGSGGSPHSDSKAPKKTSELSTATGGRDSAFNTKRKADAAPLRIECERLLRVCHSVLFPPELQEPINRLATILRTAVEVLDGGVEVATAQEVVAGAGEPAGEYIVAIAPHVLAWLNER